MPASSTSDKSVLRRKMLGERNQLSWKQTQQSSEQIGLNLQAFPQFQRAGIILFYATWGKEVDTLPMISLALESGKRVSLPIVRAKERDMLLAEIRHPGDLAPGYCSIPEPRAEARLIAFEAVDVVIVPGLAFDSFGYRLGYGGGYYDRLLKKLGFQTLIGLAYNSQVLSQIPHESYDVPIDWIITENKIIDCQQQRGGHKTPQSGGGGDY